MEILPTVIEHVSALRRVERLGETTHVSLAPGFTRRRSRDREQCFPASWQLEAPHGGLRAQNAPDAHSRPSGRRATIPGGTDVYDARTTRTERVWVPGDTPWPMRYLAVISRPLCFDRDLGRSPHTYRSILRRYPRARARRVRHALHQTGWVCYETLKSSRIVPHTAGLLKLL